MGQNSIDLNSLKNFKFEKKENYGVLYIDKPETLNALNRDVIGEFSDILDQISGMSEIRVLIITGSGKAFVAGADIGELKVLNPDTASDFIKGGQELFLKLEKMDTVTIAAINGFCLGGGLELALSCDIRYASTKAKLGLPETSLGLVPGFGGTQRLSRLIGRGLAVEYIFSAKIVSAEDAFRDRIVNKLSEPEELMADCEKLTESILKNGPNAVKKTKKLVREGLDLSLEEGLLLEREGFSDLYTEKEPIEGCSAFIEKRKPNF
jgi:enoyl-CoA hydratase